ncbi:alpha/beta hydrolase [Paenilisteria rocourtiae]|uniref:Phospholipase/carboxylesterase n=1 Tax=Listeria rocourtiae TaxID=647910 RepID=A0A4R6ZLH5_9LIST|nr:alpha/beta hydrolase [Listeria rocourtiae]MBC1604340.1 alpha/beta hydrolase [Listeria rocourtiae]TDR52899.1 phospholipase/carboxylesterase [Listeria rocourtiae]
MFAYDIYEPIDRKVEGKFPTIFTLHGIGADELDMPGTLEPVMDRFVIVSIRGSVQQGPGYSYYKPVLDGEPSEKTVSYAANNVHEFIEMILKQYSSIDRKKLYLFGFDQGGIVAMTEFVKNGGMYHGGVFLSVKLPTFLENGPKNLLLKSKRIFIGHGTKDPLIPVTEGERTAKYFESLSDDVTFQTFDVMHNVSEEESETILEWFLKEEVDNPTVKKENS